MSKKRAKELLDQADKLLEQSRKILAENITKEVVDRAAQLNDETDSLIIEAEREAGTD